MPYLERPGSVAWDRGALRWVSVVERFRHGALVAPLQVDLGPTLEALRARLSDDFHLIPPVGYAHATLGPADPARHRRPTPCPLPGPLPFVVAGPDLTAYSIRLRVVPDGWVGLAALFGQAVGPEAHVTLGYPSAPRVRVPEVEDLFDGVPLPDVGLLEEVRWISTPPGDPVYSFDTLVRWELPGGPHAPSGS